MSAAARTLRLGTRGSLLAVAQSRQVAAALTAAHPGLQVALVTLTTPGDRDRQTPLDQVRDGAFFSAEIDRALVEGRVDFAVHSRKDLDGPRPESLVAAALAPRANPRDVVLYRADVLDRLRAGRPLRVGTSSARRATHVSAFLAEGLPHLGRAPTIDCRPIRGPVEQRLACLQPGQPAPAALDGVVLAMAGLERLWRDPDGYRALRACLGGLRWMVLPLTACPAAPGQGALALECRAADERTRALLQLLHDDPTAAEVAAEYAAAERAPADGRSAFAATAVTRPELGQLLFARGAADDLGWQAPDRPRDARPWEGSAWHQACQARPLPCRGSRPRSPATFVAHWRAAEHAPTELQRQRVWVSGVASWRRLAARGIWVEGCADGLGFDAICDTLASPVLQLPALAEWQVLTRDGAQDSWRDSGVGEVLGTYALEPPAPPTADRLRAAARDATHFFWTSRDQYLALREVLPATAEHACGAGKTLAALRHLGVRPHPFPNRATWRSWVA
jgi:hydroxymethylbilane synthase